jgi:hypothetical protein
MPENPVILGLFLSALLYDATSLISLVYAIQFARDSIQRSSFFALVGAAALLLLMIFSGSDFKSTIQNLMKMPVTG